MAYILACTIIDPFIGGGVGAFLEEGGVNYYLWTLLV